MRIGIVCYPTFGGSGVVATELGKALAAQGDQVHFISYQQPARLDRFIANIYLHEVQMETGDYPLFVHPPYEWALSSKIVQVVEQEKLDLLHVHYAIPHASAAFLAQQILLEKGIFIPFITTLHGTDISLLGQLPIYKPVIEFAMRHSNFLTSVSENLKNQTLQNFDLKGKSIEVIPNFIDLQNYQSSEDCCKRAQLAKKDEFLLIHVSNFRKVKRIQDVLEIFEKVQKQIPARLLLVGDGPEKMKAEEWIQQKKLRSKVRFFGNINYVNSLLAHADIFLLPSEKESFGLAALEAFAAGCPVVSSDAEGIPEVNTDGKTGFVLPIGDTEKMAEKVVFLAKNPSIFADFKKNAFQRASDFELKKILPQYQKLYQKAITLSSLS